MYTQCIITVNYCNQAVIFRTCTWWLLRCSLCNLCDSVCRDSWLSVEEKGCLSSSLVSFVSSERLHKLRALTFRWTAHTEKRRDPADTQYFKTFHDASFNIKLSELSLTLDSVSQDFYADVQYCLKVNPFEVSECPAMPKPQWSQKVWSSHLWECVMA